MTFRPGMASNSHQHRFIPGNPVVIPKRNARIFEFVERSSIRNHRGMHNPVPSGKVAVPACAGMENQMVVMFQSLRQRAKVRLVLRIEQARKATRCKNLPITKMLEYVICEI